MKNQKETLSSAIKEMIKKVLRQPLKWVTLLFRPAIQFFDNFPIQNKILLLTIILLGSVVCFSAYIYSSLRPVFVGGPIYSEIIKNRQFISDIAPPSFTILDPFICAMQLADSGSIDRQVSNLQLLKSQRENYEKMSAFWMDKITDSTMKAELIDNAEFTSRKFFNEVDSKLIPALENNDFAEARNVLQWYLIPYYDRHRTSIDQLAQLADSAAIQSERKSQKSIDDLLHFSAIIGIVIGLLLMLIATLVARMISKPIRNGVANLNRVAGGDFSSVVHVNRRDEAGAMLGAINTVSESLSNAFTGVKRSSEAVRIVSSDLAEVAESVRSGAHRTKDAAGISHETSGSVYSAASSIAEGSADIARSTRIVALAMEDMRTSGAEVVKQCEEESSLAKEAMIIVDRMTSRMEQLVVNSEAVSGIIDVISNIAQQTQMLSINASIEAVNAGVAGRGFSVVAREVKDLSDRTNTSALQISTQIDAMLATVQEARAENNEILRMVQRFSTIATKIDISMLKQNTTIAEIAESISKVDRDIQKSSERAIEMQYKSLEMQKALQTVDAESRSALEGMTLLHERSTGLMTVSQELEDGISRFKILRAN